MIHIGSEALICILSLIRALLWQQASASTFSHFYILVASEALKLYKLLRMDTPLIPFQPQITQNPTLPLLNTSNQFCIQDHYQHWTKTNHPNQQKISGFLYLHSERNLPIHLLCCSRMYSTKMYPSLLDTAKNTMGHDMNTQVFHTLYSHFLVFYLSILATFIVFKHGKEPYFFEYKSRLAAL